MTLEENSPNIPVEEKIKDKEEENSPNVLTEEKIGDKEEENSPNVLAEEKIGDKEEENSPNITNKDIQEEKEEKPSATKPMLDYENINTTGDIEVPPLLIDQVIGHEESVETIKKAAKQRRNVLLIGNPGVGKSMLAKGMAELLPPEVLQDILVYPNAEDQNNPIIRPVPAGEGKKIVKANKSKSKIHDERKMLITLFAVVAVFTLGFYYQKVFESIIAVLFIVFISMQFKPRNNALAPKLLVNNGERRFAPYMDATGSHAGALLGDVRHDPYQSGGLGTPPHERVEAGMIHKANKGVLYIDEIGTMSTKTQQELLSAMQEKKYSITGQSENSSGAMVRTQTVPCDFVLVASGNIKVLEGMHIAMRSRIRGYGYEVFMKDTMDDTIENRKKLVQFVAQEVKNDGRIPQFRPDALDEIIIEAKRRAGKKDSLTLKLRDLGGLVRASGDVAIEEGAKFVTSEHVITAKKYSRTLEQQMADMSIENRKDYSVFKPDGGKIGMVNGLAIIGDRSGIVSPIAAEAAPTQNKNGGKIIATGKLGEIAKESVENVSALVKKYTNKNISDYDIHVQFIQTYDGVEGDSASVSIAAAVISAIEEIPLDQSVALTGSLNVRGDVMPIGGATGKIEAAAEAGIKTVLIPKSNLKDVMLDSKYEKMVKVIPCETLSDVLENILMNGNKKDKLIKHIKELGSQVSDTISDLNIKTPNTQ